MSEAINGLGIPGSQAMPFSQPAGLHAANRGETSLFENLLLDSLGQTNGLVQSAQTAVEKGMAGEDITQVEMLTSMKKADLALRMTIQIRNKIVEAYAEIKQMQL